MSNPAKEVKDRLAVDGFTEIKYKHKHGITLLNPVTGKSCYESQVAQIYHYGANLEEADSAWTQDIDINYFKVVKCDFNLRARKLFNGGDLLRWTDPITGEYVILQPNNLSWIDNVSGSQQFIASPAAVSNIPTAIENADALLKRDWNSVTGEADRSCLNAFRILRNKRFASEGVLYVKKEDDTTDAWTASLATSAAAETITGIDP